MEQLQLANSHKKRKFFLFVALACISIGAFWRWGAGSKETYNSSLEEFCGRYVLNELNSLTGEEGYTATDSMLYFLDQDGSIQKWSHSEKLHFFTIIFLATPQLDAGSLTSFLDKLEKYKLKDDLEKYWKNILLKRKFNEESYTQSKKMMRNVFLIKLYDGIEMLEKINLIQSTI